MVGTVATTGSDTRSRGTTKSSVAVRHVVLVTIDQWRADALGVRGLIGAHTPNLDRLAADGTRFDRHYVQCAPCGPSRASLLTGRYLMNHRSVGNGTPLDAGFANLARSARTHGWEPVLFGYTDTVVDPRTTAQGDPRLQTYEGVLTDFTVGVHLPTPATPWLAWLRSHGYDHDTVESAYGVPSVMWPSAADGPLTPQPAPFELEHSQAAFLNHRFMEWAEDQDGPWLAHLTYLQPHRPWSAPAPFHNLLDPADMADPNRRGHPSEEGSQHPFLEAVMLIDWLRAPEDPRIVDQWRAAYLGCLAEIDHQIGELLDWLDRTGLTDDTAIIVTSDHGEQLGDHWLTEKLGYFAESYHVPCIIRLPHHPCPGTVVDAFTESIDLMPTVLDLIGATVPGECDGRSLMTFLETDPVVPPDWRTGVYWEFDFRDPVGNLPGHALGIPHDACSLAVRRDRHHHYVHFAAMEPLLFDLDSDPHCFDNRVADPALSDIRLGVTDEMLSWRLRHADRTLANSITTPLGLVTGPPRRP